MYTARFIRNLSLSFVFFGLAACAFNPDPPYVFKPGEKTAKVYLFETGFVTMCKDSKFYSISNAKKQDYALVPAGERISLGRFYYFSQSSGNMMYSSSCFPMISFIPDEGQSYIAHPFIFSDKCLMEVVKRDDSALNGVSLEPSLARNTCYKKPDKTAD